MLESFFCLQWDQLGCMDPLVSHFFFKRTDQACGFKSNKMCDYQREYSFVLDDSTFEGDVSMASIDSGFESMWVQVAEELRHEREINELDQLFQQKLSLSPPAQKHGDQWMF
ncbi:uncharacterized protein LOC111071008 [Drosophila obscura]|uniref:uncharacterized protein LOC111071008 n=1 Tax=Drosophila obscura TaxID=7282 RepID=UPI001BB0E592|nr:uncharacterized protein LOC111071008 [Drosophila obscura]